MTSEPVAPSLRPEARPRSVLVTGASGYLGSLVVRRLLEQEGLHRVVAVDCVPPRDPVRDRRVVGFRCDVRTGIGDAAERFSVDTVIHLAYPLDHQRRYRDILPYARDATEHLLRAIEKTRVAKVVLCSSTTVYGGHRWKTGQWHEDDAPRPNSGYHYAVGKLEMESVAAEWARRNRWCDLVVARPCIVLGPSTSNYMVDRMFGQERIVRGHEPPMQFLHEDDFFAGLLLLLAPGVRGTFNLTPDDVGVSKRTLSHFTGPGEPDVTYLQLKVRLLWRWWTAPRSAPVSPAVIDLLAYSWSASNLRLRAATGFAPRRSSEDALLDFFRAYRSKRRRSRHAGAARS